MAEPGSILQSVIEATADAILVVDNDDRVVAFNRKFVRLWNLPEGSRDSGDASALVGSVLGQLKDPEAFTTRFDEIRSRPDKEWFDVVELKDGRSFERYSIPRIADGKCVGRVLSFRDVSERHRAKAALRESDVRVRETENELCLSEMRFRAVFESAPVGITLLDTLGRFTSVNPAFCAMLGYSEEEILALGVAGISHPEEYAKQAELLGQLNGGTLDRFQMEKRYLHKNGASVWALISVSLGRGPDRRPLFGIGVVVDITGERAARESVRLSEERFRTIFQATDVGVGLLDRTGSILEANPALLNLLGYSTEELRTLGVQGITHPDDFALCWAKLSQLAAGPIDHYDMEKRYIRKDGKVIWCHLIGSLGRDSKGQPMFCIGMLNDVTQRKLHETERDKLLFLEWQAHQSAVKAVRLRDDFIAIASHELRTPLTPLKLQVQFLRKRLLGGGLGVSTDRPELLKMLEISDEQLGKLQQLVEDMLDASRIRAGRMILVFSEASLSEMVRAVARRMRSVFENDGIELNLDLDPEARGRWDRQRIEQVIANLLTNAVKYGNGKPVTITTTSDGRFARLIVRDRGIGISEDDQVRIFEEFERIAPIETYGGFGLGLYISRQIVLAHRGTTSVESQVNEGATFTVTLPQDHGT